MSETHELNIERLEQVELDSLVHDNTHMRDQATFMHVHGHSAGNSMGLPETFPLIMQPESGIKIAPEEVIEALKTEWAGRDERSVTDGKEKRVYWQSLEPVSMMAWTTAINYKLVGKGRSQREIFDGAVITVNPPMEYQTLLSRPEVPEIIQKAQDKKAENALGSFAAKTALLTNDPKAVFRQLRHLE